MYLLAALQYEDPTIVHKPTSSTPVPRPRKACRTCRSLKTKCLPGDTGPTGRCSRCARLGIECEYVHLPRGPRKGSRRSGGPPGDPSSAHSQQSQPETPPFVSGKVPPKSSDNNHCPVGGSIRLPEHDDRDAAGPHKRQRLSPARPFPSLSPNVTNEYSDPPSMVRASIAGPISIVDKDTPVGYDSISPATTTGHPDAAPQALNFLAPEMRTTLEEYFDPDSSPEEHQKRPTVLLLDAVSAGLVTECDASFLFRKFEQHVSPSSHLFDPAYHTYERIRQSVPLFNAIMYASARFFSPHVADALFEMALTMVLRALHHGGLDLTMVQALLVLVYWKKPKDPTAYHKLGLATRLMCQLRVEWDLNPDPSITRDDERARVDAERTAFNAFNMDASYSMMLRLPVMPWSLPKSADLMRWATAHRHLNVPGDYFKVFVTECWELQRGVGVSADLNGTTGTGVDSGGIIERITAMMVRWDSHPCLTGVLRYLAQLLGKTFLLKAHIVAARSTNNCIPIACLLNDISHIIRHLNVSGEAVFLNDLSTSMLSTPAVIVYNGRNDFDPDTMACAAAFVRDMSALFRTLPPNTPQDHALRYVQRCYIRVDSALDQYTAGMLEAHDNIVGQLHQLLAENWPALAFSPDEAVGASVLDPSWLASMQFM